MSDRQKRKEHRAKREKINKEYEENMMRKKRRNKQIERHFEEPFVEDVVAPYLGFKRLQIIRRPVNAVPGHKFLYISGFNSTLWVPGEGLEAECKRAWTGEDGKLPHNPEHVPHPACTCGIYAFSYKGWIKNNGHASHGPEIIISMGGYVLPHADGYRSSIAQIEAIIGKNAYRQIRSEPELMANMGGGTRRRDRVTYVGQEQLAKTYGVPLIKRDEVDKFVKDYNERWGIG